MGDAERYGSDSTAKVNTVYRTSIQESIKLMKHENTFTIGIFSKLT